MARLFLPMAIWIFASLALYASDSSRSAHQCAQFFIHPSFFKTLPDPKYFRDFVKEKEWQNLLARIATPPLLPAPKIAGLLPAPEPTKEEPPPPKNEQFDSPDIRGKAHNKELPKPEELKNQHEKIEFNQPGIDFFVSGRAQFLNAKTGEYAAIPVGPPLVSDEPPPYSDFVHRRKNLTPGEVVAVMPAFGFEPIPFRTPQARVWRDAAGNWRLLSHLPEISIPVRPIPPRENLSAIEKSTLLYVKDYDFKKFPPFVQEIVDKIKRKRESGDYAGEKLQNVALATDLRDEIKAAFTYPKKNDHLQNLYEICSTKKIQCDTAAVLTAVLLRKEFKIPAEVLIGYQGHHRDDRPDFSYAVEPAIQHAVIQILDGNETEKYRWYKIDSTPKPDQAEERQKESDSPYKPNSAEDEVANEPEKVSTQSKAAELLPEIKMVESYWLRTLAQFRWPKDFHRSLQTFSKFVGDFKRKHPALEQELSDFQRKADGFLGEVQSMNLQEENLDKLHFAMLEAAMTTQKNYNFRLPLHYLVMNLSEIGKYRALSEPESKVLSISRNILDKMKRNQARVNPDELLAKSFLNLIDSPFARDAIAESYGQPGSPAFRLKAFTDAFQSGSLDRYIVIKKLQQDLRLDLGSFLLPMKTRTSVFAGDPGPRNAADPDIDTVRDYARDSRYVVRNGPQKYDMLRWQIGSLSRRTYPEEIPSSTVRRPMPSMENIFMADISPSMFRFPDNSGIREKLRNASVASILDLGEGLVRRGVAQERNHMIDFSMDVHNPIIGLLNSKDSYGYYKSVDAKGSNGGGTDFNKPFAAAYSLLLEFQKASRPPRGANLIMITDGEEDGMNPKFYPERLEPLIAQVDPGMEVRILVIHLGDVENAKLKALTESGALQGTHRRGYSRYVHFSHEDIRKLLDVADVRKALLENRPLFDQSGNSEVDLYDVQSLGRELSGLRETDGETAEMEIFDLKQILEKIEGRQTVGDNLFEANGRLAIRANQIREIPDPKIRKEVLLDAVKYEATKAHMEMKDFLSGLGDVLIEVLKKMFDS